MKLELFYFCLSAMLFSVALADPPSAPLPPLPAEGLPPPMYTLEQRSPPSRRESPISSRPAAKSSAPRASSSRPRPRFIRRSPRWAARGTRRRSLLPGHRPHHPALPRFLDRPALRHPEHLLRRHQPSADRHRQVRARIGPYPAARRHRPGPAQRQVGRLRHRRKSQPARFPAADH